MSVSKTIRSLWGDSSLSIVDIAVKCGIDEHQVRKIAAKLELPKRSAQKALSPKEQIERSLSELNSKSKGKADKSFRETAIEQIDELRKSLKVYEKTSNVTSYTMNRAPSGSGSHATAVVLASDWHWGEDVTLEQTNGLNEFNPSIRKARAEAFFSNVVRLVKIFQKDIAIENMVLALIGDFISGNIHEELLESNHDLVIDEIIGVQSTLASGIQYILDNTNLNLVIPTASGNHGRITKKTHFSTEAGNSLEYLMYHNLANHFASERRVKFILSRSYLTYVDIEGFVVRFHHGHAVRVAGGIGGLFPSMFKAVQAWDKSKRADLTACGHFHQVKDGGNFITNGSLVGFNDFAVRIKADYEKPKQVFFLIDHKRREKTITCPVFLD